MYLNTKEEKEKQIVKSLALLNLHFKEINSTCHNGIRICLQVFTRAKIV